MIDSRRSALAPGRIALFAILLLAYVEAALVLGNYGSVWAQPEEFEWRAYILSDGAKPALSDVAKGLNWRVFEYEPRSTRPLSHYVEILDTKFRAALWHVALPHPSLSLTWIVLLGVTPLVFFKLLRQLDTPPLLAGALTAWLVGNPGTLSLAAVDFRPSKPLANCAIVCCLYWASRIYAAQRDGRRSDDAYYGLCLFMLASFLVDETAILSYAAVFLLFPRVVLRNARRLVAFLLLPPLAYVVYFHAVPALSALAGFDLPRLDTYGPARAATSIGGLQHLLFSASVLADLVTNLTIFLSDVFGLVNPALSRSWFYTTIWWSVVGSILAALLYVGWTASRAGAEQLAGRELVRGVVLLAAVTFFANVTLHLVANHLWGLHWLNTYWPIFWLLFLALALKRIDFHPLFVVVATAVIITASVYDFSAMNHAFKMFFYYRTVTFEDVLAHRVNRFDLPRSDGQALRERTRAIWKGHQYTARIEAIPTELYYLVPDLGLIEPGVTHGRKGTLFNGSVPAFDLIKEHGPKDRYFVLQPAVWARRIGE